MGLIRCNRDKCNKADSRRFGSFWEHCLQWLITVGTLELIKCHFLCKTSISRKDSKQAHFQVKNMTGLIGSDLSFEGCCCAIAQLVTHTVGAVTACAHTLHMSQRATLCLNLSFPTCARWMLTSVHFESIRRVDCRAFNPESLSAI